MFQIEPIDRAIADILMEDGRLACSEIARRIGGVSERTVRNRLDRLIEEGVIRVAAIPNPQSLGYKVVADVFIQVEPGALLQVARTLVAHESVSYVGCSMGESDISIQVVGRDNAEVFNFVTEVVGKVEGVRKTTTVIVPLVLKDVHQWRIPRALAPVKPGGLAGPDGRAAGRRKSASEEAFR
jgi:Lrp/AsnC family transcriptional regulator for asnA, asnC and gidA